VAAEAKYSVYLDRQEREISARKRAETMIIPPTFRYENVVGLSAEARSRLSELRPATLGQAAAAEGITPAAVTLLGAHLSRRRAEARS